MALLYRLTVGGLLWIVGASASATILGCLFNHLSLPLACVSLLVGLLLGSLGALKARPASMKATSWTERLVLLVFALACLRTFFWVVFQDSDQLKVLSRNNLGDLSLHWHYIVYLAHTTSFWPEAPTFTGTHIRYPIGVDLFNSLLLLLGIPVRQGLIWVGLAGSLFAGCALFRWGRAFAVAGLLFNGGVAGFQFFNVWHLADYQSDLAWKNLFLAIFVTQRGFLFCLPAGLLLLDSWRHRLASPQGESGRERESLPFWAELLLYAAMPLFHFHTFLFLSTVLGIWVLLNAQLRPHALRLIGAAFLPATFLTLLVTEKFSASSVITLHPGWMQEDIPFLEFWFGNFGLWLFLAILVLFVGKKNKTAWLFLLPATVVFLLCSVFLFAPWAWDNTKLYIWAYLVTLPFIWEHLIRPLRPWLQVAVLFATFFSGAISLLGGLKEPGFSITQRSESDCIPLNGISFESSFACAPEYNHPLVYRGRKLVMGYPGHLFGHGLPYGPVETKLQTLMLGQEGWREAAKQLQATHLFWGDREEKAFPNSSKAWLENATLLSEGKWGALYRLEVP